MESCPCHRHCPCCHGGPPPPTQTGPSLRPNPFAPLGSDPGQIPSPWPTLPDHVTFITGEPSALTNVCGLFVQEMKQSFSQADKTDAVLCLGRRVAKVVNARKDTCSREVLRHDDLKQCVKLSRVRDHFICK